MDENSFSALDARLKADIYSERDHRQNKKNHTLENIPYELRFLANSKQYHIKEMMALCKGDYRELVTALLMKKTGNEVKGYSIINTFRARPLIFVYLLSIHPQSKAKLVGKSRFMAVKFLVRHPRLLELAKSVYRKINR